METATRQTPGHLVDAFAREHRRRLPGLLGSLVMTGSATLDDWRPGISDIDLVLITTRPVTAADLPTIAVLHAVPEAGTPIDGLYLTEAQLAAGPDAIEAAPQVVVGKLVAAENGGELTWVTWREVENGVESTVSEEGASSWLPSTRRFPGALDGARAFSRKNLFDYWAPLGSETIEQLAGRSETATVNAVAVRWIALGPARLVATIEDGLVLSKTEAARFASRKWPEFEDLLSRVVASRAGENVEFTVDDARRAIALLQRCVDAADGGSR
ncbi:nucleotidyltransferase domain-containing protein [Curtobacterium sp. MCBD17_040]|uniref:nucleotidyltransferase domain-containing protein n=1 Tax=Curtobacterium sp. MCBD17_040 TaxID=2175674 RepID=UPI000DA918B0|nr:nucleotidyltransferase domain-containing protein [Curtobacterium sp. MCBD17_040]WIB65789.1 nucleotidyltransferase domain-containing protein [Curtobacterium sp. MCBD17_040]